MFTLPKLRYDYAALKPAMSSETLYFHHNKHHAGYISKVNSIAEQAGLTDLALEDLIILAKEKRNAALFNNAAQTWNHAFFWESMTPSACRPVGRLLAAIAENFGHGAEFRTAFVAEGSSHFGSGWVWLVRNEAGSLEVISTHDAETVITREGCIPLLVCDLWEHAYYLDWKNDRKKYLETWFDELANWTLAASQFDAHGMPSRSYRFPSGMVAHG